MHTCTRSHASQMIWYCTSTTGNSMTSSRQFPKQIWCHDTSPSNEAIQPSRIVCTMNIQQKVNPTWRTDQTSTEHPIKYALVCDPSHYLNIALQVQLIPWSVLRELPLKNQDYHLSQQVLILNNAQTYVTIPLASIIVKECWKLGKSPTGSHYF